jgi:hypothetical protein
MPLPIRAKLSDRPLLIAIAAVLAAYGLAAVFQLPQSVTDQIASNHASPSHQEILHQDADAVASSTDVEQATPLVADSPSRAASRHPPYWMAIPFVLLLGTIAILPLVPITMHWWKNNLHRFYIAGGLAVVTLLYFRHDERDARPPRRAAPKGPKPESPRQRPGKTSRSRRLKGPTDRHVFVGHGFCGKNGKMVEFRLDG